MTRIWYDRRLRKFVREVGSVVLGVLIALGLGEVATSIRWRFDAADAREALAKDFLTDAGVMHERMLVGPCIDRRLREIDGVIRQARQSGALPAVSTIGRPPTRPVVTAAWDMSVSSGVLAHLPANEAAGASANYDMIKELAGDMKRQSGLWARLSAIENAAGPISPELTSEMMLTTAELRKGSAYVHLVAEQIVTLARTMGPIRYWMILDRDGGTVGDVTAGLRGRGICAPLTVDGKRYTG